MIQIHSNARGIYQAEDSNSLEWGRQRLRGRFEFARIRGGGSVRVGDSTSLDWVSLWLQAMIQIHSNARGIYRAEDSNSLEWGRERLRGRFESAQMWELEIVGDDSNTLECGRERERDRAGDCDRLWLAPTDILLTCTYWLLFYYADAGRGLLTEKIGAIYSEITSWWTLALA